MFDQPMYFHLVNSKTLNAFTTGGHHVYVYNALFQMCKTEDELAAVMSHEFAHIYCRHVQQGNNRQTFITGVGYAAAGAGYVAGGQQNGSAYASTASNDTLKAAQFVGMKYTRTDEAEADEWGFQFYCRAGWDPNQFRTFFQRMVDAGYDKTPAIQSDHPTLASRVKLADQRAATWTKNHGDTMRKTGDRIAAAVRTDHRRSRESRRRVAKRREPEAGPNPARELQQLRRPDGFARPNRGAE